MSSHLGDVHAPSARYPNKWGQMADDQNEKPQVVRFPEPRVEAAREAEERRRVAEIAREIEELGHALEGRDRRARFGTAKRAESSPAQEGQPAEVVGDRSTPEPEPLPTVVDMSSGPKEASPQVEKFATIPASPQAAEDARLKAEEAARALEQQLAAREDEQKLLAQELARSQAFEQQLAIRDDEQKLLVQ